MSCLSADDDKGADRVNSFWGMDNIPRLLCTAPPRHLREPSASFRARVAMVLVSMFTEAKGWAEPDATLGFPRDKAQGWDAPRPRGQMGSQG